MEKKLVIVRETDLFGHVGFLMVRRGKLVETEKPNNGSLVEEALKGGKEPVIRKIVKK